MSSRRKKAGRILYSVTGLILFAIFIFPYFVAILTSLKSKTEVYSIPVTFFPKKLVFYNFIDIWTKIPLSTYFMNTIIVAVSATLLTMVCAIPAGYALARMRFRGANIYLFIIIITQMFSPVILLVGLYRVIGWFGLVNRLGGLILVNAAFNQAFAVWILRGCFTAIPYELEQAAWIDGSSRWRSMFQILIPLAAPGIVTALIFIFISAWNEFTVALTVISSDRKKPLTIGIYAFFGKYDIQWQYLFATSIIVTIPVIILFLLIEKNLVSGLTTGGVKG